jgi:ribosome-binding protein aMBF1 (putative translation factor)
VNKNIGNFYVHKMMKDGHLNICKECVKSRVRKYWRTDVEKHRENERRRYLRRIKDPEEREKRNLYHRWYKDNKPLEHKAHQMVANHLYRKGLNKEKCELCGSNRSIHAHHEDYHKPLSVMWVCCVCHRKIHQERDE